MNIYECSSAHTPTVEIEASSAREAENLYRFDFVGKSRVIIQVRYIGPARKRDLLGRSGA